jgi:hypothetical protein
MPRKIYAAVKTVLSNTSISKDLDGTKVKF